MAAGPVDDEAALAVALRLKALADPARVKLVSLLFSAIAGEECSRDLAEAVGLSESTVSHHLSQLRRAGLVDSERRGMNVYQTGLDVTRWSRCARFSTEPLPLTSGQRSAARPRIRPSIHQGKQCHQ